MSESVQEYARSLETLKVRAQGVAVRDEQGGFRSLTQEEMRNLGIWPEVDLSYLDGQEVVLRDSGFVLRLKS